MRRRWLAWMLVVCMLVGILPQSYAMADGVAPQNVQNGDDVSMQTMDDVENVAEEALIPLDFVSESESIPVPENESATCHCTEACTDGAINQERPVCKVDYTACQATREVYVERFDTLPEDILLKEVPENTPLMDLGLPDVLDAFDATGQPILVSGVTWEPDKPYEGIMVGQQYQFTAKMPEGVTLGKDVVLPVITVKISGSKIEYQNGVHYIHDPMFPGEKFPLYCMNNKLHWPHHTENMGDLQVPNYTDGYLTPDDFKNQHEYDECMRRLSKLLYAGYPYNGERLYEIVEDSSNYTPTEEQFNEMLIVPPVLQEAYPFLGHHDFSYDDWKSQNKEHLEYLRQFTGEVIKLNINGGTTANGLTYADISAMPFYKAAFSITNCNNQTPLEAFQYFYGASYFVTEEEAYNATQNAIWHLMYEYNIPDNNIESLSQPLAEVLYTYSERGGLLNYKPHINDIKLKGDLTFHYNPKDGMWHSGSLMLIEPPEYRGLYRLILPKGITALCDNLNYVYGNEEYELVSDHPPKEGETFAIQADFVWLKEFKQYSPSPDVEFEGKKFQHMIGAMIYTETLRAPIPLASTKVGDVAVTKTVIGEDDPDKEFHFKFKLPFHQGISGQYGDLLFQKGVAEFTLKAGETKTARNLPAGAEYRVVELDTQGYSVGKVGDEGQVPVADLQEVAFTNTKLPDLALGKTVTGLTAEKDKKFTFTITLNDKEGQPINGEFGYIGSVKEGLENEAIKPEDGILQFTNGSAQIQLSHGQQITLKNLPYQSTYKVTEEEADQDGYDTSYNKDSGPVTGTLNGDQTVLVENHRNIIPAPPSGGLDVSKTVTGIDGDKDKSFSFKVELSDKTIAGDYGNMRFENGVAKFNLKHGDSIRAIGLPVGITYTVSEADNEGYTVTKNGDTGSIKQDTIAEAVFTNHKDKVVPPTPATGGLKVSKTVTGNAGNQEKLFTFNVELSDKNINGKYGDMSFRNGFASFQLKHGTASQALNLPVGVTYTVSESDNEGYTVTKNGDTGSIKQDTIAEATFTNHKDKVVPPTPATGGLKVSKTVTGNAGDQEKLFTFNVELSDKNISGKYGDMNFENGVAMVKLKHGESKQATSLPVGVTYIVTESDNEGYTVTKTGDTGSIKDGVIADVNFINYKASSGGGGGVIRPTTELTVKKVWKLDDGGKASDSVKVALMRDGKEYKTIELSEKNNWKHTWKYLDKRYEWTVTELQVPDGFIVTEKKEGTVITLTNDDKPKFPTEPNKPTDPNKPSNPSQPSTPSKPGQGGKPMLPQTGQPWWPVYPLMGGGVLLVLLGVLGKKKSHDEHSA